MADMTTMRMGGMTDAIRSYDTYRRTFHELNHLSDYELSDLGISRPDIRAASRFGTYER